MYIHRLVQDLSLDHLTLNSELVIGDLDDLAVQEVTNKFEDWDPDTELEIEEMSDQASDDTVKYAEAWKPGTKLGTEDFCRTTKYKEEIVGPKLPQISISLTSLCRSFIIPAMLCLEL